MAWPKEPSNRTRWRNRHPEVARLAARQARWKQRGLKNSDGSPFTQADYDKLLVAQHGVCRLCDKLPSDRMLDADHNYNTGLVRGLLCHYCNKSIAIFDRTVVTPEQVSHYLGRT